MNNNAFNQLITPTKKSPKPKPQHKTEDDGLTDGMSKITGGGSKQVNINISIGAINGIANIEQVNNLEKSAEVNQSADFIVQEIVRKINGAMMVQEG